MIVNILYLKLNTVVNKLRHCAEPQLSPWTFDRLYQTCLRVLEHFSDANEDTMAREAMGNIRMVR